MSAVSESQHSSKPRFVHLHVHTEYSIWDSIVRIDDLVHAAAKDMQPALAIADAGNLFGWLKFYQSARSQGIKPICSVDIWVAPSASSATKGGNHPPTPSRLQLVATHREGYLRLCDWLSRAWLQENEGARGVLCQEWFTESSRGSGSPTEGLIALSGAQSGEVGRALLAGQLDEAAVLAKKWKTFFPDAYYLEVQRTEHPDSERQTRKAAYLSVDLGIPLVATHPVQFLTRQAYEAHEIRVCIAQGKVLADSSRQKDFFPDQYFKTQEEMLRAFSDLPSALENTVEIAKRCNLEMSLGQSRLPDFPTPPGVALSDFLRSQATEGLRKRFSVKSPALFSASREEDSIEKTQVQTQSQPQTRTVVSEGEVAGDTKHDFQDHPQWKVYLERLNYECDRIIQMGFSGYFLTVADFIDWAKKNDVPVGPGRGSGAGSLVAFSLGITDLDPIPYALLFERFLNPERVSMPDFDIDFCQEKRHKVIEYVRQKYGEAAVSQIATFGRMASRAVIRDVGRVLGMSYTFCDQLSKLIPVVQNKPMSLSEACENEPVLRERLSKETEVRELLALAKPLEDLTRSVGMHAGGVLIAPGRLVDFCPLYKQPDTDGVISQFDKDDVEAIGLVKFDFLGLRNLTVIGLALQYIRNRHPEFSTDINLLEFNDARVYQLLRDANTIGVFQLESDGMRKLLRKIEPDRFEDIIAVLALYRPGPLGSGMVDDFIFRKKGQQAIDYFHPDLTATLQPTYGVIVYQEQVMQIAQIIGGYTLGSADLLRRAMGKKKPEEMAEHREIFIEGAKTRGYATELATKLFDLMAMFAEYGFNKSHTAAYAVITYQTAWLKALYPAEFWAATLSLDMHDTDKIQVLVHDAKQNKIDILAPDVQCSHYRFEPVSGVAIRYGLGAIKGVGCGAVEEIVRAREAAPFADLFDFCARVDRRVVNRRVMEALVRAGAFDSLDADRAKYHANISRAMQQAEIFSDAKGQGQLFSEEDSSLKSAFQWEKAAPWSEVERLQEERIALGFPLSGHLFRGYQQEARRFAPTAFARLNPSHQPQWISGVVVAIRKQMTRRGQMAFVALDDLSTRLEVSLFNELFIRCGRLLKVDELLVCHGKVVKDDYTGSQRFIAEKVLDLAGARQTFGKNLCIRFQEPADAEVFCDALLPYLSDAQPEPPGLPVMVQYHHPDWSCDIKMGWRLKPEDSLLKTIRQMKGFLSVEIVY